MIEDGKTKIHIINLPYLRQSNTREETKKEILLTPLQPYGGEQETQG